MRTAIRLGSLIGIWVMFLSAQAVFAETSVLDTSFNSSGIVTTFFPGTTTSEEARAVAIQSDSKIVVVGRADNEFAVARLTAMDWWTRVLGWAGS